MISSALILTEAGKNIGFGHYSRCSALQQELEADGIETTMAVYFQDYDIDDNSIIKSNWLQNLSISENNNWDIVIVDSYLASKDIYIKLDPRAKKVVAIDDYNRITYPVQLVINPNVFFNSIDYSNQRAKCLGGKDYVILRSEFRKAVLLPITNDKPKEILVTIGGSDFRKLLPVIIQACLETEIPNITVIDPEGIASCENQRVKLMTVQNAGSMCRLMQQSDIVISACGQTLHELASLGKATVGICLDVDQIPNQAYYLKQEFLPSKIQWNDGGIANKIKDGISAFTSKAKRSGIAINSPTFIDKNGVMNIVSVLKYIA
jgi:UDP-2,4-diacetamido-2,4,6-trideoxy-beta-L-altropyranose hydrolase